MMIESTKLHMLELVLVTLTLIQDHRLQGSKKFCASYIFTKFLVYFNGNCWAVQTCQSDGLDTHFISVHLCWLFVVCTGVHIYMYAIHVYACMPICVFMHIIMYIYMYMEMCKLVCIVLYMTMYIMLCTYDWVDVWCLYLLVDMYIWA